MYEDKQKQTDQNLHAMKRKPEYKLTRHFKMIKEAYIETMFSKDDMLKHESINRHIHQTAVVTETHFGW